MFPYLGFPITVGKTERGWSSPPNPFFDIPVPLSITMALLFLKSPLTEILKPPLFNIFFYR